MSYTHPRFQRQVLMSRQDCISAMAECLVRLSPYDFPETLVECITEWVNRIDTEFEWVPMLEFIHIKGFDLQKSTVLFEKLIMECPAIVKLNDRKNGNQEPYAFTDRYSPAEDPDNSFIDLTALAQNMTCHFASKADVDEFLDQKHGT